MNGKEIQVLLMLLMINVNNDLKASSIYYYWLFYKNKDFKNIDKIQKIV
jgi:hypothetical protein